jgi:octaprenyl-diphosphate synthase
LLHDEVIDQTDTRRGEKSINSLYDNHTAIMLGDILYSLAFSKLASFEKEIIESISLSVSTLSLGEFLDVRLSQFFNEDTEKYMDMLYKKTSALIESVSFSSAVLAKKDKKAFKDYGKYMGICFQLVDDLLDITQSDEVLGKPAMSDFKEGKVTIPYILLFNLLSKDEKIKLKNMHKKELNNDEKIWLKLAFEKNNIKEKTLQYINTFYIKAKKSLPKDNEKLLDVLNQAINRKF